jgi:hypothetical protein
MSNLRAHVDAWEPQLPSEGFADRATAAIVRDLRTPRARRPLARGLGWRVVLAAAACVAFAGAAWAWTSAPRRAEEPTLTVLAPVERADPTSSAAPRGSLPEAFPSIASKPVVSPSVRVRPRAPRVAPSAAPAASAPKVPMPQCNCNAFACDCGPE